MAVLVSVTETCSIAAFVSSGKSEFPRKTSGNESETLNH